MSAFRGFTIGADSRRAAVAGSVSDALATITRPAGCWRAGRVDTPSRQLIPFAGKHGMNTQEMKQKISEIVRTDLDRRFREHLVFDPIIVERGVDEFDDDAPAYIRIRIIFDGDQKHLDPKWTVGMTTRIRPKLAELGIEEFPLHSFIEKNEWEQWLRRQQKRRRKQKAS